MPPRFAVAAGLALGIAAGVVARADETAVVAEIETFFEAAEPADRVRIVQRMEADSAYDRARLPHWLHKADLFEPLKPGRTRIHVLTDDGNTLAVTIRIPSAYDHRRPYPLLYCLHGTNSTGDSIIDYVEQLLGQQLEEFVAAAPTAYRQVVVHSSVPPSTEHLAVLRAVKETVHVNSDRVYALGCSRGGHAAWTLAVLHSDQFAGVVPISGTLLLPGGADLFETFLPNIADTHVFACWGQRDVMSADYVTPSESGGIAGLNCRLCALGASLELPTTWFECPDKGHTDAEPPRADVDRTLSVTRVHYPRSFQHVFRLVYQGSTPWVEPHNWRGPWWDDKPIPLSFRNGENPSDPTAQQHATVRAIRGRLGELSGEIHGQEIRVHRKKIDELTVWVGDGMINWDEPVLLVVNGRQAFEGKLTPDLLVCLTQAARTRDFDRLRWAGLRFKSGSATSRVTGQTPFPNPPLIPQ